MRESMSFIEILVSNAATLMPIRPFLGILFRSLLMAGVGLNARVGEPTINNFNPVNCSGFTLPTRSISTSSREPRALPIAWAICPGAAHLVSFYISLWKAPVLGDGLFCHFTSPSPHLSLTSRICLCRL